MDRDRERVQIYCDKWMRSSRQHVRALDEALDEAVLEAGRAVDAAWVKFSEHGNHALPNSLPANDARLITWLYARLDDLNAALTARDAANV